MRQNRGGQPESLIGQSVRFDARHRWPEKAELKMKSAHSSSVQTGLVKRGPNVPSTLEWPVLDSVQRSGTWRTRAFSLALKLYPCAAAG